MGKIPDRWLDYVNVNKPLENLPIIAFKTPLSERYHKPKGQKLNDYYVEENNQFTPNQLYKRLQEDGFELDAVIDLTFTFRYYDGMKFQQECNVRYEKVKCAGQKIPNDNVMNRVAGIFNSSLLQNGKSSKKLVGIHCTHGVNRTGYIISRYLIEWLGYEPEIAIKMFNEARGHQIEREPYLDDLKNRTPKNEFEVWKANIEEQKSSINRSIDSNHDIHQRYDCRESDRDSYQRYDRRESDSEYERLGNYSRKRKHHDRDCDQRNYFDDSYRRGYAFYDSRGDYYDRYYDDYRRHENSSRRKTHTAHTKHTGTNWNDYERSYNDDRCYYYRDRETYPERRSDDFYRDSFNQKLRKSKSDVSRDRILLENENENEQGFVKSMTGTSTSASTSTSNIANNSKTKTLIGDKMEPMESLSMNKNSDRTISMANKEAAAANSSLKTPNATKK